MLYLIGLGLGNPKDVTIKGKEAIKSCDKVFLESYTSVLSDSSIKELSNFFSVNIEPLNREKIEDNNLIFNDAKNKNIALLVVGDVFSATTHSEILMRAKQKNIDVEIIHNASIFTAVSTTGLQLYKFGKVTSIVKPKKNWFPKSPYKIIKENSKINAHTLCLLDIKIKQNYFMTINEALKLLLKMEEEINDNLINEETKVIGVSSLGGNFDIKYGTISDLIDYEFTDTPHSLIIPGKLHFSEKEVLEFWNNQ